MSHISAVHTPPSVPSVSRCPSPYILLTLTLTLTLTLFCLDHITIAHYLARQDINHLTMAVSPDQDGATITQPTPQSRPQPNDLKQQQQKPTPKTETIRSLALLTLALFDTYILPPQTRTTILQTVAAHPFLSSFLLAQLLCSTIPLLLFAIGIMTAGVVAAALFACLGLLVLVPVLLATGVLGGLAWGWGWFVFLVGRWAWGVYVQRTGGGKVKEPGLEGEEKKN